jgi:hypothetical protein
MNREIIIRLQAAVAAFASLNPIIALSYRRMMLWLHAPAHPHQCLSCAAELFFNTDAMHARFSRYYYYTL